MLSFGLMYVKLLRLYRLLLFHFLENLRQMTVHLVRFEQVIALFSEQTDFSHMFYEMDLSLIQIFLEHINSEVKPL